MHRVARRALITGVVQGVGFRPGLLRIAADAGVEGWVRNVKEGVDLHVEGTTAELDTFFDYLYSRAPGAARISDVRIRDAVVESRHGFVILDSSDAGASTAAISPDLALCADCLHELFDPGDRRFAYPYINCTNCGPRYSVLLGLPYDRPNTTMRAWALCEACADEYGDPDDRRFHAQPVACPACGPTYRLERRDAAPTAGTPPSHATGEAALREAAALLTRGAIVALKGIGGYHLACDARNAASVAELRSRKFRKEKPFAVMVADLDEARRIARLTPDDEALLRDVAGPIVLAEAVEPLDGVAPNNRHIGVMLPYAPIHHLLFAAGAPKAIVLTSANRSNEPIAYEDDDAWERLAEIADAFLVGERPIARRVDDSVVRTGPFGPTILRRARGLSPAVVATLPGAGPLLAVGADLKNSVTLVVDGQAFQSQYVGDLSQRAALDAHRKTIGDFLRMYEIDPGDLTVVHDAHPEYASTAHALATGAGTTVSVQHHRAHVASVLAERGELDKRVVGVALDGTGYGDDGSIWGGEFFVGSIAGGFDRVAHLRPALLPGGDAAARSPVQAAAGFLAQADVPVDLHAPPFRFPPRYREARDLARRGIRTFTTTSFGRLFDAAAALIGFTGENTFEGQAAIWLEHHADRQASNRDYPFPDLDYLPLLDAIIEDRKRGLDPGTVARAFHEAVARGVADVTVGLAESAGCDTIVLSGGVFQNQLLLALFADATSGASGLPVWTNNVVPPNDGGVSLGQAAIAAAVGSAT